MKGEGYFLKSSQWFCPLQEMADGGHTLSGRTLKKDVYINKYQHHTAPCFGKHTLHHSLYLPVGQAARTLHLFLFRVVQQEAVANGCVAFPTDGDVELYAKELRVCPSDGQSSRVVFQVVEPPAQFAGAF